MKTKTETETKTTGFRKLEACTECEWYEPLHSARRWSVCPDCGEDVHTIVGRYIITTTTETFLGIDLKETESIELERKK